jgi:hypothetical protein
MSNIRERNKSFLQYLGGLMLVSAPAAPALASTPATAPPPPQPSSYAKVDFAHNLEAKMAASATLFAEDGPVKYTQKFGKLWPQIGPWWEVIQPKAISAVDATTMLPSEAYRLVSRT